MPAAERESGVVVVTETRTAPEGSSFDAWVESRRASLLRFAYLVTGSRPAAEDAVQSALTRACERCARVRGPTTPTPTFAGWSSTRTSRAGAALDAASCRSPRYGRCRTPTRRSPGRVRRGLAGVRAAVPTAAAAVVLRYYKDLENGEIAAVLGCAESTARAHVHRASTALRPN